MDDFIVTCLQDVFDACQKVELFFEGSPRRYEDFVYDFEVDGIYYNIISEQDLTCEITCKDENFNSYFGDIVIPSSATLLGKFYVKRENN